MYPRVDESAVKFSDFHRAGALTPFCKTPAK